MVGERLYSPFAVQAFRARRKLCNLAHLPVGATFRFHFICLAQPLLHTRLQELGPSRVVSLPPLLSLFALKCRCHFVSPVSPDHALRNQS